ncbi:MAG: gliding motility-associated C-terminal domain-containing protein [Bacteroidales bacterium]|nr:gliding motility-associated C-terminal domain-containing protein [Bacteroidales bacterium]
MYSTTTFYVFVSDNHGCSLKDSLVVEVDVVNCGKPNLYVPNIFTPNDDGKNDKVFVSGDWIEDFTFEIFDRWGEKVFSTSDLNEGWDGTFNGRKCDAAVYFYKLEVRCQGGKTYIGGGDITLIR